MSRQAQKVFDAMSLIQSCKKKQDGFLLKTVFIY